MSKKDSSPPPRPPAPRGISKRSASNNSLKFSFKSLEEEEENEEDLTNVTGDIDRKLAETKAKVAVGRTDSDSRLQNLHSASKSFEEEKTTLNLSRLRQNLSEISSVVKEKVSKKIEDFLDNDTAETLPRETAASNAAVPSEKQLETKLSTISSEQEMSKDLTARETTHVQQTESKQIDEKKDEKSKENEDNFQIVDDFYTTEAFEDFTGVPSSGSKSLPTEMRFRNKSLKEKIKRGKPQVGSVQVSLSTLTKASVKSESAKNEELFHDASEQNTSPEVAQGKPTPSGEAVSGKVNKNDTPVPWKNIVMGSCGLFLYWIIPMPSYLSGMIMGMIFATLGWLAYMWIMKPSALRPVHKLEPLSKLLPLVEPQIKQLKDVKTEDGIFKGWMNEIAEYNPDNYHINHTHSVHVHLEDTTLRLRRPKSSIPKRAMWDEEKINVHTQEFIHQRHFNLSGSKVFLLPPGLVKKRIWSKKYPICIALNLPGHKSEKRTSFGSTPDSDSGFELVSDEKCQDNVLFLFARTCREKEDWYKRLEAAARCKPLKSSLGRIRHFFESKKRHIRQGSNASDNGVVQSHQRQGSTDSTSSSIKEPDSVTGINTEETLESFIRYMGRMMPREMYDRFSSNQSRDMRDQSMIDCEEQMLWLNALISRCCWDFLRHEYWQKKILEKLQKKLGKIHIPYFIEELQIINIDLGSEMPVIRKASRPYFDEDGFWADLAVNYEGGFQMTIQTKVNLMKLKSSSAVERAEREMKTKKSAVTDPEEEDSAESTTDEDEDVSASASEEGGKTAGRKFMKYVNKITQSKYFQSATEMKYIKKAMEGVSNTPILLTVELRYLSGELSINIPFPPSDRLWYGFRENPKLTLVAKPKVGAREVTVTHITEWIEKKLSTEFQRTFVIPNMDDLIVPLFTQYLPSGVEQSEPGESSV